MRLIPLHLLKKVSLAFLVFLAFCLVGWHLYPESFDHSAFKQLNGWLEGNPGMQSAMAFANTRKFDSLAGLLLAAFFLVPGLAVAAGSRRYVMLGFVPAALLFQPWRMLVGELSGEKPSPGRVFWNAMVRLDELNPGAKVASDHSFPSDHTAVLIVWATYIVLAGSCRGKWLALPVAAILSLPRLFGGGHWLSDVLFGSPLVALPPLIILFYFDLPDRFLQFALARLPQRLLPKRPASNP